MHSPVRRTYGVRLVLACLTACCALTFLRAETFTATGRMTVARSGHQATLLLDGRVLVSGGSDSSGAGVGRAEIFNPVTRTWSETGSNGIARLEHAAVLLQDGRTLVVGGVSSSSSCRSNPTAETYDPATGLWSPTGELPIVVGRGPMAVRLSDGRVLVSGGGTACGEVFNSAALFDPPTGTWSMTAPMTVARQFHTAALLADERVLVTGGATAENGTAFGAEAYDPATATWSAVDSAASQQGTACDGYLPTYASLLRRGPWLVARATADDCSSVTLLPGAQVVVAGGSSGAGTPLESAELFNPAAGRRTLIGPLQTARAGHSATRLRNGAVLLAGGHDRDGRTATVELYIPEIPYASSGFVLTRGVGEIFWGTPRAAGRNSGGHLFISYALGRPPTRILEWDLRQSLPRIKYVREIGAGLEEFHSLRIDPEDNIWAVAPTMNEIIKFSAEGDILLRFGRRPATDVGAEAEPRVPPLASPFLDQPSDVAWDPAGNIFVSDGDRTPRVVKYDARGRFIMAAGSRGSKPGEMRSPHSLAADAGGNVYVADGGNARIQVFDNNLALLAVFDTVGTPWALCITPGPQQNLYSASNPDRSDITRGDTSGEIYKLELDGTIVGRLGREDNSRGIFRTVHFMDCSQKNEIVAVGISDSLQLIKLLPQ